MSNYILVVDDDICLAYAIQSYLSVKDKKVFIVDNPAAAIKLLMLYTFDLVISDIMMPKCDGYQFLSQLRADKNFASMPFIFLTAKGMTYDRIRGYDLGCNAYLTKPFHPSELLSIANNLLNSRLCFSKSLNVENHIAQKDNQWRLTYREMSVLRLLIKGMMNKEIADSLGLSVRNVEKYVSKLLNKTNTRNRTELARFSLSNLVNIMRANDGTRTRE